MARRYKPRVSNDTLREMQRIPTQIGTRGEYIKRFDSLGDALRYALQGGYVTSDVGWAGGLQKDQAVHGVMHGTIVKRTTMDQANRLLDKIDASFRDRELHTWQPSMMGAYPIVPDYLMGRMDSMRMRQVEESNIAPVRIYVECAVSAGVTHDQLIRRGTAIAALLQRMGEERPVELHMFAAWQLDTCAKHKCLWAIKIDSTPVSINQILHVIAEPAFLRMINFNISDKLAKDNGDRIRWGMEPMSWAYQSDGYSSNDGGREKKLREKFELQPQDIIMQRGYLPDAQMMERDPVAWVHEQLEKQRKLDV